VNLRVKVNPRVKAIARMMVTKPLWKRIKLLKKKNQKKTNKSLRKKKNQNKKSKSQLWKKSQSNLMPKPK
jgi:hypothetical protein